MLMSSSLRPAAVLLAVGLSGCPEPVVQNPGDPDGIAEGANTVGVMGAAPPTAPAASGPGPADQGPGGAVPDADLDPVHAQEDLADGAVLKGTLGCDDCTGKLLVRVLPPPPDQAEGDDEGIVLITQKIFDEPGSFEIRVPKDRKAVVLQVVEDTDGSGKPSTGERMGLITDGPITVAPVVENIQLTVGVFPQMAALPDGGGADGGPPAGSGLGEAPAAGAPGSENNDGEILSGQPPATGAVTGDVPPPAMDAPQPVEAAAEAPLDATGGGEEPQPEPPPPTEGGE